MSTWFFSLGQTKHFVKRTFMKGIKLKDKNASQKTFANCEGKWFITTKSAFHLFYNMILDFSSILFLD